MRLFAVVFPPAVLVFIRQFLFISLFFCAALRAEDTSLRSISDYSVEELLNVPLTVASSEASTLRESPGVVTLVTREQIENSGAQDLIDVLRLVPGFEFGSDVEGVVGVGFRGNWAHEGKILLLVDEHEINETMFSNIAFGNHFSVDQIERIEIIRGPGSAIYGGYAELAVIKIVTKLGAEAAIINASYTSGFMQDDYTRQNVQVTGGELLMDELFVGASGFVGYGNRSDQDITDFFGTTYNLSGNSDLDPMNLALRVRYHDLLLSFLYDDYQITDKYPNDVVAPKPYGVLFTSYLFRALYTARVNDSITIVPELRYKIQKPWHNSPPPDPTLVTLYEARADRYAAIVKGIYQPSGIFNAMVGAELDYDTADYSSQSPLTFSDGTKSASYHNYALFSEAGFQFPWLNFTAGARFEDHEQVGGSLVPRLGLTKVVGDFHGKLLYSRAFRAPGIENIHGNANIRPERTETYEMELGYSFSDHINLTANVFDTHISDPIIFKFDTVKNLDTYVNQPGVGTRGFEIAYRMKYPALGYVDMTYSFYTASENKVASYKVPGENDLLLAFPQNKITLNSNVQLSKNLSLNPSFIWTSKRFGFTVANPPSGKKFLNEFGPELIANIYLLYRNAFVEGLELGLGVFDIFSANHQFIQPYDGDHAPIPGPSRELVAKVGYTWK